MHHFPGYNMNWADYSYASDGSIMVVLIMILGALVVYLLWDRNTRTDKWSGVDIEPDYGAGPQGSDQQGIPYTPSLSNPFDDPEVPNRTMKPKKKKKKTVSKKRGYLPVVKNQKKRKMK